MKDLKKKRPYTEKEFRKAKRGVQEKGKDPKRERHGGGLEEEPTLTFR